MTQLLYLLMTFIAKLLSNQLGLIGEPKEYQEIQMESYIYLHLLFRNHPLFLPFHKNFFFAETSK